MTIQIKVGQMLTFAVTTILLLRFGDGGVALSALAWGGIFAIVSAFLRKKGILVEQTTFLLYMVVGYTYATGLAILFFNLRT